MKKGFSLPEKEYFTREELAKRWNCELDLVDYYVRHGLLREAFYTHQAIYFSLQVCQYFRVDACCPMFQKHRNDVFNFESFVELAEVYDVEITDDNLVQCPKFAYIQDPAAFYTETEPGPFTQGQLMDGYEPEIVQRLVFLQGFGNDRYIPVDRSKTGEWIFKTVYIDDAMGRSLIVPREERDRFEAGTPIRADDSAVLELSGPPESMTPTTERGYLVTIGMLAKMLSVADDAYVKPDGSVNVKGLAQALEKASMSLEGHRAEVLKKRIAAGLKTLKDIS